ncbi:TPA: tyrosine-type recombinase/integrase [Yersinia enterocolitica]|nr:tyrosine-type recombinase/integrase [Yersinia enterocolitica]
MPLSARQVETAKPQEKAYKLSDGGGLFLYVSITGAKSWRLKYRINGKEKLLTIGLFPATTLADARQKRDEAKSLLADGVDPSQDKKAKKVSQRISAENTFEAIAKEWHSSKRKVWTPDYSDLVMSMFIRDVFPFIGHMPIKDVKPLMLLDVLRKIEARGAMEMARKTRRRCGEVFKYAIVTGRAEYNPAPDLTVAMTPPNSTHYPFLTEAEVPDFIVALNSYFGSVIAKAATQILMLTGLRTKELRHAKWIDVDLDAGIWTIPIEVMKKRRLHIVPLSRQVINLFKQLQPVTGHFELVFPGRNDRTKPISENTVLGVIRRVGYEGRTCGHGFRHQMSSILNEHGFEGDWVERQLAHLDKSKIRGVYNHAQYIDDRKRMMQWYADYLDSMIAK